MNERIKELALQAGFEITPWGNELLPCVHQEGPIDVELTKFAQLMVKECANYINERTLDWDAELRWIFNDGSGDMAVDVDDLLSRHFGVEE